MDKKPSELAAPKIDVASMVSDFLFRWRKIILIVIAVLVLAVVAYGITAALAKRSLQQTALAVYELRQSFEDWKDAHPEDLLTARKSLQDEELEIDEETEKKAEQTEQDLNARLGENASSENKNRQAWAYWIQAQKAEHLQDNAQMQKALENLLALEDETLHSLAQLHLAGLFYGEGKQEEALRTWKELADREEPIPEQIIASIYLANYFARQGDAKEDAIFYWKQVQSLADELLQNNGLEDESSFLAGENLIAGNFRSTLQQWNAMAENQLLFLQSEKIQIAADGYDPTAQEANEEAGEEADQASGEAAESVEAPSLSFDVPDPFSN